MVSHCYWKNDEEIIAFERKKEFGPGFYLMMDKTQEWTHTAEHAYKRLNLDGIMTQRAAA